MTVYRNVPAPYEIRRGVREVLAGLLLLTASTVHAQSIDTRWKVSGDAGGVIGGTWLAGDGAPTITGGAGAELSLRAVRAVHARSSGGFAVRVASQSLTLRENGEQWTGPTLTTASFVGVTSTRLAQTATWQSSLELGAGVAALAGARSMYPFAAASQVAPVLEAGVALRHEPRETSAGRVARSLLGQTGFFARYQILRLDPGATPVGSASAGGITGWAGRIAAGLRIDR